MANKQTAVEWLEEQLVINGSGAIQTFPKLFEQAKQMEEEQRAKDFFAGVKCTAEGRNGEFARVNHPNVELVFFEDFDEYINPDKYDY